jgi:hypothetical protein
LWPKWLSATGQLPDGRSGHGRGRDTALLCALLAVELDPAIARRR